MAAVEAAQTHALDLPSESEAFELLAARLGEERTAAELDAIRQIVAACDRLPLAIAVVAAPRRLAPRPVPRRTGQGAARQQKPAGRARLRDSRP